MGERSLREVEHPEDVRAERALGLLLRDLLQRLAGVLLRGVVDEDVELLQLLHRALDGLRAKRGRADVARLREGTAPLALDEARGLARVLVLLEIEDRDVGALGGERERH